MRLLIWIVTTLSSAGLGLLGGYLMVRLIETATRKGTPLAIVRLFDR
jgi:hypothetical protein